MKLLEYLGTPYLIDYWIVLVFLITMVIKRSKKEREKDKI